ncbi:UNVERIFIED_CONTAM: MarR family transcriptional regulator [Williamsia faeni]
MSAQALRGGVPIRHGDYMDPSEHTEDILWLLKLAFHYGRETVNDAISRHGVTTAQSGLLRQLAEEPGLSGAELSRRLMITPQGAQLALSALERHGFIERRPDPNHGRIQRAYLTKQGTRITEACYSESVAAQDELFSVLTDREQQTLRKLLLKVVDQGTRTTTNAPKT